MQYQTIQSRISRLNHPGCLVARTCHIPFLQECISPIYLLCTSVAWPQSNPQSVRSDGRQSECRPDCCLSVYSPPDIVGGDDTAWCRMLVIVLPLTDDFVIDTFREWLYSLLFGFRFQPILIGLYVFFFAHFFAKLN
jgi:hypothetical protein